MYLAVVRDQEKVPEHVEETEALEEQGVGPDEETEETKQEKQKGKLKKQKRITKKQEVGKLVTRIKKLKSITGTKRRARVGQNGSKRTQTVASTKNYVTYKNLHLQEKARREDEKPCKTKRAPARIQKGGDRAADIIEKGNKILNMAREYSKIRGPSHQVNLVYI